MTITIFYSWQSDTPFNHRTAKKALRDAASKLEEENLGLTINIFEATTRNVGTHHIPDSILKNITDSDIFIGDLTTLGIAQSGKKLQNPNVLIETGYALAQLGWGRLVVIFNRQFGEFGDLPFDLDRRSCLDFKVVSEDDKNGIGQLKIELVGRIKEIIDADPPKPARKTEVVDKMRLNDIKILKEFLAVFTLSELDEVFRNGEDRLRIETMSKVTKLTEMVETSRFHINDRRLKGLMLKYCREWPHITQGIRPAYNVNGDFFETQFLYVKRKPQKYKMMRWLIDDLKKSFYALLRYVRLEYHEIEVN